MNLTDADIGAIVHAIQSRKSRLLSLVIAENKFTNVGIKKLVEAIKKDKQRIDVLTLDDNPIGDAGVQHILKLFGNDILDVLSIENIGLTDNGVKVLVDGILRSKRSSPVRSLNIGKNKGITDHSVKQLLRLVGLNKLVDVDVVYCSLSDEAKKQLEDASKIFTVEYYY
ncbi:unnamed protein product [Adineta steineri]|uniref:Uncharacterized protein n=1 Tax=Adineta steineri TaxID=433720 RepID=A0A815GEJ1_9BILA|nr:unnamed protein product [Adineta steineri]CAF3708643.1 unnamed protein product [Adineta steineri]